MVSLMSLLDSLMSLVVSDVTHGVPDVTHAVPGSVLCSVSVAPSMPRAVGSGTPAGDTELGVQLALLEVGDTQRDLGTSRDGPGEPQGG